MASAKTLQRKLEQAAKKLNLPLKVDIVPERLYPYKCTYEMNYEYVTLHNAAYPGTVEGLDYYMRTCCLDPALQNIKSWHFSCGESLVIQGLPIDRNGWHAGDGAGKGNRASIGIEITRDTLSPDPQGLYYKGEDLACRLAACLLYIKGYGIERVKWHQTWMPQKACPWRIVQYNRQKTVLAKIETYLRELEGAAEVPQEKPADQGADWLWRVYRQVGAYTVKANAEKHVQRESRAGRSAIMLREKKGAK